MIKPPMVQPGAFSFNKNSENYISLWQKFYQILVPHTVVIRKAAPKNIKAAVNRKGN